MKNNEVLFFNISFCFTRIVVWSLCTAQCFLVSWFLRCEDKTYDECEIYRKTDVRIQFRSPRLTCIRLVGDGAAAN